MPWLVSTSSLLSQQSSLFQSLSFSDLLLLSLQLFLSLSCFPVFLVRTLVATLGSDDPQPSPHLEILNHVSPLVHRFQRLGCGHPWGALILPFTRRMKTEKKPVEARPRLPQGQGSV